MKWRLSESRRGPYQRTYYQYPTFLTLFYLHLSWQSNMKETSVKFITINAINMLIWTMTLINFMVLKLNSLLWRLDVEDSYLRTILRDNMSSLAFATGTTSKHQRVTWPRLYRKLIEFLRIVVWHMRVSAGLLEVMWLKCDNMGCNCLPNGRPNLII